MTPQEKIILYYMNLYTHPVGEDVVTRKMVADMLGVSVPTAKIRVENLVKNQMVVEEKKPLARGLGYKYVYCITEKGRAFQHVNFDDCIMLYRSHQNDRLIAAMSEAKRASKPSGRAKKVAKEQKALL